MGSTISITGSARSGRATSPRCGCSRTCEAIKRGCYAQLGAAESTFYRDETWPFFRLGQFVERADQTSRLLDVRFAQLQTGLARDEGRYDFTFWTILLRAASAYHSYRRIFPRHIDPKEVARFLVFDARMPRSLAFCLIEIQGMIEHLRRSFGLRNAAAPAEKVEAMIVGLDTARKDERLLENLHSFNDWIQLGLINSPMSWGRRSSAISARRLPPCSRLRRRRARRIANADDDRELGLISPAYRPCPGVSTARGHGRELHTLRVLALDHPGVAGDLLRSHEYLATILLDPFNRGIGAVDVEIIAPVRTREVGILVIIPPTAAPPSRELVDAHRPHVERFRLRPAEHTGIEGEGAWAIARMQLIPSDQARRAGCGAFRSLSDIRA